MAVGNHVENPFEFLLEKLSFSSGGLKRRPARVAVEAPQVRRIAVADLKAALKEGMEDLGAVRADVLFIGVIYPIAGLFLLMAASQQSLLPLAFPLVSGFALIGPIAAVGLYEISRRRERGEPVSLATALDVLKSPSLGSILVLGLILLGLFLVWLAAAYQIYNGTLGPWPPTSFSALVNAALTTPEGLTMTVVGCAVGAVFAAVAFVISAVSIPLLLDRDVGPWTAVETSIKAVAANPGVMAVWGLIVAGLLVLGSIPALAGLIVVVPLLGHATWRLYRKLVV
jgi:uncharacterized membrane protein